LDGDFRGLKIKLSGKLTVGRHQQNSLVLTGKKVSTQHAIVDNIADEYFLTDLGSTNGTLLNTRKIEPNNAFKLHHGSVFEIGEHRISFNVPTHLRPREDDTTAIRIEELSVLASHSLIFVGGDRNGERMPMLKRITIGRKDFNNICLLSPQVSGEHCEICFENESFFIKDSGSVNGTYVNGRKARNPVILNHGDMITVGENMLAFDQAGMALNINDNIKKIRAWSLRKVRKAVVFSSILLLAALIAMFLVSDLTIDYLKQSKIEKTDEDLQSIVYAGVETSQEFKNVPEMSFEYTGTQNTKIQGWNLYIQDRSCDFCYDETFKSDGKWALVIKPDNARNPKAEIRLRSNNSLNLIMKSAINFKALEISALVSVRDFTGVTGIRVIWHTQANPEAETIKIVESTQFIKNAYKEMKSRVEVPKNAIGFGIELFLRGNASKIWWDKVIVKKASNAEMSICNPIIFPIVDAEQEVTAAKSLTMSIDKPMSAAIKRGNLEVISDISPVLLCDSNQIYNNVSKDADVNSGIDESGKRFTVSMGLEDMPHIQVAKLNDDVYIYKMHLFSNTSNSLFPLTLDYARTSKYYEIVPDLSETKLDANEYIALSLDLIEPYNLRNKYHLRLFNEKNASYIFLKDNATISNVSEICWGNNFGYTGISITPNTSIYIEKKMTGYKVYLLLKGAIVNKEKIRIKISGYSTQEYKIKENILKTALKLLDRKDKSGDVIIFAKRIMKAFESDSKFVDRVSNQLKYNVLNIEKNTLYNRVIKAWEYIQKEQQDDPTIALDVLNDGIKAGEEFTLKYSALYQQDEVKDKTRDLRKEKPKYMNMLSKEEKQQRLDDAQELLYRAKTLSNKQSSNYSPLQSMLFLKALINKYLPIEPEKDEIDRKFNNVIDQAIKLKIEIEDAWNDTGAELEFLMEKITEIKKALTDGDKAKAQELAESVFRNYPFTKYRNKIQNLIDGK
ncbi:MAG: FHA domain-containing protein, partial [Planctomycetes bacterium]|nr:FHA domain-containing protein [Planctomycetota bacterium]